MKDKSPVKLKKRVLKNGNVSLFLEIYSDGLKSYEFLKLYLIPEHSQIDKERNKVTMMQAESRKAKRVIEIQSGKYGIVANSMFSKIYFSQAIDNKRNSVREQRTKQLYKLVRNHIDQIGDILIINVSKAYVMKYINYLDNLTISDNTKSSYYKGFCAVINKAVRDGFIYKNPCLEIEPEQRPKKELYRNRCYLTIEEVGKMACAYCPNQDTKRAFLFACYTGLRYSDLKALRYTEILKTSKGYQIERIQEKTNEPVSIPLSDTAIKLIDINEIGTTKRVFRLVSSSSISTGVRKWARNAKINKRVTFHTSRHTAATLLLTYGADIYTVSKILGHTDIKTTQIYAEVVNEKKINAVNAIPDLQL